MEIIFLHFALILFTAFIVAYVIRTFNQPLIIGYIFAGIIVALIIETSYIEIGATKEIIDVFSKFGIAFLLFIVGLNLNPRVIKEIGFVSIVTGLGQILFTFIGGYFIAYLLGFDMIASIYIGLALAFSSTIIAMKLLSDKKKINSLYGKISIGILIIQDFVAVIALLFISSIEGIEGGFIGNIDAILFVSKNLIGGSILIFFLITLGFFAIPKIVRRIADTQELLFLFSICWCFIIAALFDVLGFSIEIGALIAGIMLSMSPYSTEMSARIRPLRDFFLIIFFIILGFNIFTTNISNPIGGIESLLFNALIFSAFVLIGNPLIIMFFMALSGYTKKTNFSVGITLSQISEFSIIVATLGVGVGHINQEVLGTLALTLVITIMISTYMISYSKEFYSKVSRFVSIFEKKKIKKGKKVTREYNAILFGYNRIGFGILRSLKKLKKKYLVIDFNPDTINALTKLRIPALYGDADDAELIRELPLEKIDMAVSTIPDYETNVLIIETVRMVNPDAIIIARAHSIEDALDLYQKGASYVLTPHFLGGEYISKMIEKDKIDLEDYKKERKKHVKSLRDIKQKGYQHPDIDRD